ncbi:casein kinase II, regulatory subunit [Mycena olivaceomarginata]|nr:casein kinase II, regulatory subunit [Mycena olivaceomarginata]
MEDLSTDTSESHQHWSTWISLFLSSRGNEYFCEVDEDFIQDSFNLTGLHEDVANYDQALDVITDRIDDDLQDDLRGCLDTHARLLYGLIHARWILTPRGMAKMVAKYECGDFGYCPRVFCHSHPLLPVGLADLPFEKSVKLYCGRCEDIYSPKSSRYNSVDGPYFGTTFPHLLCLEYPTLMQLDTTAKGLVSEDKLHPKEPPGTLGGASCTRVYGFGLNQLQRSQDVTRDGGAVASSDDNYLVM